MLGDFKRLWATNFLDDLSIEVTDYTFPNGAVGKIVTYHMEERERIKIVDYRDTDEKSISIIKRSDIDDKLREKMGSGAAVLAADICFCIILARRLRPLDPLAKEGLS